MDMFDFEIVDYHGGSIRVFARISETGYFNKFISDAIKKEEELGLFEPNTYIEWQNKLVKKRDKFLNELYMLRCENPCIPIIGVGAAAKANTFLNYYCLDKTVIKFITDSSIHKKGKYTPLTRIPIVDDKIFENYTKVYALILSWNISDTIKEALKKINPNIQFIQIYHEKD